MCTTSLSSVSSGKFPFYLTMISGCRLKEASKNFVIFRRARMTDGMSIPDGDHLPTDYEMALSSFGRFCIEALIEDKFSFTIEEIEKTLPEHLKNRNDNIILGFLVKSNVSISKSLFNNNPCYQPLHKTFLEFVAAFYLKSLVDDQEKLNDAITYLQDIEYSSVEQILLYTVEMLSSEAYHILNKLGDIKDIKNAGFRNLR